MQKLEIAKSIAAIIVGAGTSRITNGIISNNVSTENAIDKVTVTGASIVIGAMAGKATKSATNDMVDEIVDAIEKIRKA